jgi:hypothetical protein
LANHQQQLPPVGRCFCSRHAQSHCTRNTRYYRHSTHCARRRRGRGVVGCYVRRLVMQREGRKNWGTMGCPAQHSSSTSPARCGPTAFVLMMCQHYGLRSAQGYFLGPDRHDGTVMTQWTIWVVSACNPTRVAGTIHPGGEGRGGGGRHRRSDRRGGGGGSRRCRSSSPSSSPIGFPTRSGQRSKRCGSRGG